MGKGGQRPPSTVEELREATREAHEVLRDIRTERKGLEEARAALRKELEEALANTHKFMLRAAQEASQAGAAAMAEDLERARALVFRKFDQISSLLLGGRDGGPDMEEMTRAYIAGLSPEDKVKLANDTRRILVKDEAPAAASLMRLLGEKTG
jgi:hypothetical protein